MGLVAAAIALYFASYVLRALGWQKLFPSAGRPGRARCLAACGAAAASGAVLPFRLDYLVKIGTLRRLSGAKLGLEAIALSIISLGLVDAIAFLRSRSQRPRQAPGFRPPLIGVVLFGVCCCGLLVGGRHLARLPIVARRPRLARLAARVVNHPRSTPREAIAAWLYLLGWTSRALGKRLPLAALRSRLRPTPRAHRPPPVRRRLLDTDRLRRRDRQRQRHRRDPARPRRPQRRSDQLQPRLRPPPLQHGRRSRDRRRRRLRRDQPPGTPRRPRRHLRTVVGSPLPRASAHAERRRRRNDGNSSPKVERRNPFTAHERSFRCAPRSRSIISAAASSSACCAPTATYYNRRAPAQRVRTRAARSDDHWRRPPVTAIERGRSAWRTIHAESRAMNLGFETPQASEGADWVAEDDVSKGGASSLDVSSGPYVVDRELFERLG